MSLEHSPARESGRAAFTVAEFCEAHRISRTKLYQLWQVGLGPKVIRIGAKLIISTEAATEWRRSLENAARKSPAEDVS
jgi:hypothetical protein